MERDPDVKDNVQVVDVAYIPNRIRVHGATASAPLKIDCEGKPLGTVCRTSDGKEFAVNNYYRLGGSVKVGDTLDNVGIPFLSGIWNDINWLTGGKASTVLNTQNFGIMRTIRIAVFNLWDPRDLVKEVPLADGGSSSSGSCQSHSVVFHNDKLTVIEKCAQENGKFSYRATKCLGTTSDIHIDEDTETYDIRWVIPSECIPSGVSITPSNFTLSDKVSLGNRTEAFFYRYGTNIRASYYQQRAPSRTDCPEDYVYIFLRGVDWNRSVLRSTLYQDETTLFDNDFPCDAVIIEYFGLEVLKYPEEQNIKNAVEAVKSYETREEWRKTNLKYIIMGYSLGCAYSLSLANQMIKVQPRAFRGQLVEVRVAAGWPIYSQTMGGKGALMNFDIGAYDWGAVKKGDFTRFKDPAHNRDNAYNNTERIQRLSQSIPVFVYLNEGDVVTEDIETFKNRVCESRSDINDETVKATPVLNAYHQLYPANYKFNIYTTKDVSTGDKTRYTEKVSKCADAGHRVVFHHFNLIDEIKYQAKDKPHVWICYGLPIIMTDFNALKEERDKIFHIEYPH